MIYLRSIPEDQLFVAQLELLMQHGRVASMVANFVGALAVCALLWPYCSRDKLLPCALAFFALLLLRSRHMSRSLAEHSYRNHPRRLFWQIVFGSALTGLAWSTTFMTIGADLPVNLQYLLLLITIIIAAISLAVMVVVREYFLAFAFCALWPIAWWSIAHMWDQPYNLLQGLLVLAVLALLVAASNGIHGTFTRMLSLNWQQEKMARELGEITNSLRDRNRQLQDARRQLTELANVDELTGLGNRRLVNRALGEELNRARRADAWLSVILFDVDYFKNYNDHYGHPAGDAVLRSIGEVMRGITSRAGEVVARYGGEEFMVLLPGTDRDAARQVARRLQRKVHDCNIAHEKSAVADRITVSQGLLSVRPGDEVTPENLLKRVDAALYKAKREGRNRIVVA